MYRWKLMIQFNWIFFFWHVALSDGGYLLRILFETLSPKEKNLRIIQANANNHSREHEAEVFTLRDSFQSFEAFISN